MPKENALQKYKESIQNNKTVLFFETAVAKIGEHLLCMENLQITLMVYIRIRYSKQSQGGEGQN